MIIRHARTHIGYADVSSTEKDEVKRYYHVEQIISMKETDQRLAYHVLLLFGFVYPTIWSRV